MKPSSARFKPRQPEVGVLVKPFVRVPDSVETHETASSLPNREKEQPLDETNDGTQTMKNPRWTKEETIVLMQGKNAIEENLLRVGQQSGQNEPKWYSVSLYCKQHGVDRDHVQCRKRWTTLIGEYKKIKTWESQINEEADSFWVMRAKLKRERKLPNSFEREIYDALERKKFAVAAIPFASSDNAKEATAGKEETSDDNAKEATAGKEETSDDNAKEATAREEETSDDYAKEAMTRKEETGDNNVKEATAMEEETGDEVVEAVFDDGCSHPIAEEGLLYDNEQPEQEEIVQGFEKETSETSGTTTKTVNNLSPNSDKVTGKDPAPSEWTGSMTEEGLKHTWSLLDGCVDGKLDQLIKVLERHGSLINEQIQAQKINCQLDRDQRKEHTESLVAAINRFTDAIVKIANKLQVKK